MLPLSKITDSDTAPLVENPALPVEVRQTSLPSRIVCDVSEAGAFTHRFNNLHVPVLAAFGGERLHQCGMSGCFDLDRAIADNATALYRSIRRLSHEDSQKPWDDLTFQFGPRSYLYADENRVVGYADSAEAAEALVSRFEQNYSKPPPPKGGSFYLIKTGRDISSEVVPLGVETILDDQTLGLHYGSGSREWHSEFIASLRGSYHGLSILEGTPGTGKTCYLRHLMGVLKETHRFYFIPTATMGVLSNPDFIGFWAEQRHRHADMQFVVILEDSDAALITRGADNREQVSAILNISDGILADFLRLQIICTINCKAADIDQALLRPGRLLCHRVFRRLDYAQASLLAETLGRTLPAVSDYSLAEIFAGHLAKEATRPRIGFAA